MKTKLSLFYIVIALLVSLNLNAQNCEKLIWADEFNGTTLDASKWNYDIGNGCPELCGWGNNEEQYYASDNISIGNGLLTITAKNDTLGGMLYSSGKITSKNKGDFRYGRIEARMRLPETQGLWPAFWLLPTENVYGEWPRSGEIDVMELLGHQPETVYGTLHTGLPWVFKSQTYSLSGGETFVDSFHVFSVEWEEDTMRWYVDNNLYHEVTSDSIMPWAPFQEDFYLILNVAVGGNFPGFTDSTTVLPQIMEVDWVRVYNSPDRLRISGTQPVAGATGITYNTFEIAGANYIWTVPSGSTITNGQGTNQITVDWGCTAGDVLLELQTDCDTANLVYAINDFAIAQIDGVSEVSQGQSGLSFNIPATDGGTYNWVIPSDATITSGQGTNQIIVDWGCVAGDVIVSGTGTCGAFADTINVSLQTYTMSGFSIVPPNAVGQVYTINNTESGTTYLWSVPSDATIVSGQGTNEIVVDFGNTNGDVSVDVTNTCGTITYAIPVSIASTSIYCDFDGVELTWGEFGGAAFEKIQNPFKTGINLSDHVGKTRKDPGAQDWGGIFADLPGEIDLASNPYLHMKVYAQTPGVVKFKIEDQTTGVNPVELDLNQDTLNQWINMVWDFNGVQTDVFDRIALFFDFGDTDTSYWYFDDVFGRPDQTVSTEQLEINPISVFPNPTTGQLNVNLNGLFDNGKTFHIQILNTNGQIIYQRQSMVTDNSFTVDLDKFSNGTYFIRLLGEGTQYVKTIVKME